MSKNSLLVIRIRGTINVSKREEDTLRMLRVDRNNYATIIDNRSDYTGMLQKAKDWITWGEPTVETVKTMLEKRGKAPGDVNLTEEYVKELGFESFDDLAEKLVKCEVSINQIEGLKPFFRLHPPKKGFKKSVKRPYKSKGELGYRGEDINELAVRMC
ncbi:MAG: 50S ribosomal protein L30 [Candidatus Bathyarchaeota archaeon]|nr:50S ribosomal protein L30 [Candidatus Bathyarchaeota archaeon]